MFNADAINRMTDAVVTVERRIREYPESAAFKTWIKNWVTREAKKAIVAGLTDADNLGVYFDTAEINAKLKKACQKHVANVEKKIRAEYARELRCYEIIQKMPRYDGNKKIVIDI